MFVGLEKSDLPFYYNWTNARGRVQQEQRRRSPDCSPPPLLLVPQPPASSEGRRSRSPLLRVLLLSAYGRTLLHLKMMDEVEDRHELQRTRKKQKRITKMISLDLKTRGSFLASFISLSLSRQSLVKQPARPTNFLRLLLDPRGQGRRPPYITIFLQRTLGRPLRKDACPTSAPHLSTTSTPAPASPSSSISPS